jgi:hypothetical protein
MKLDDGALRAQSLKTIGEGGIRKSDEALA